MKNSYLIRLGIKNKTLLTTSFQLYLFSCSVDGETKGATQLTNQNIDLTLGEQLFPYKKNHRTDFLKFFLQQVMNLYL